MKRIVFLFLFMPIYMYAQPVSWINDILNSNIIKIPIYQIDTTGASVLYLPMPFGKSNFIDTACVYQLQHADILSVDLVYTDYPSNNSLKRLNTARFHSLYQLIPFIHAQSFTQWHLIRQTNGNDALSAEKLMHGFVIHYRLWPSKALLNHELTLIQETTKALEMHEKKSIIQNSESPFNSTVKSKKIRYWDEIYGGSTSSMPVFYINNRPVLQISDTLFTSIASTDSIMQIPYTIAVQKKILSRKQQLQFQKADKLYCLLGATRIRIDDALPSSTPNVKSVPLIDTSLLHCLRQQSFTKALLVVDVTASMAVYSAQLLYWLQQTDSLHAIDSFACFNDGNDIPTERKVLGHTGGIYVESYVNMKRAALLMESTMQKGLGGDTPENVCEALIQATAACNACKEIVLIADNWAPVRDIALVQKIEKPVQIMVCGGTIGVHPDYVTIAYVTGGSLHFIDSTVTDFSAFKNGGAIQIRTLSFYLNKNGRVEVSNQQNHSE